MNLNWTIVNWAIDICRTHYSCIGRMGLCHFKCEKCKFNHDHKEYIVAHRYLRKLFDELVDKEDAQEWTLVSEKPPKDDTKVFVCFSDEPQEVYIAWVHDSQWYSKEFRANPEHKPIAWMPLPKTYQEVNKKYDD